MNSGLMEPRAMFAEETGEPVRYKVRFPDEQSYEAAQAEETPLLAVPVMNEKRTPRSSSQAITSAADSRNASCNRARRAGRASVDGRTSAHLRNRVRG